MVPTGAEGPGSAVSRGDGICGARLHIVARRPHGDSGGPEGHLDRPVAIRPIRGDAALAEPGERVGRGVAVVVVDPDGDQGDRWASCVEELRRRRRSRAVVGDLQHIDTRQAAADKNRVEVLLDIAHQQEPPRAGVAEQDDRRVVDGLAVRRRAGRHGATIRPEDAESDLVEAEQIAGRQYRSRRTAGREERGPRLVAGSVAGHPRLVDVAHPVAPQHRDQARVVILVRVGQHEHVDAVIPRRQPLVESDQQAVRIRPAIDDQPATASAFDEDRVALPNVERDDPGNPVRAMRQDEAEADRRPSERERGDAGACRLFPVGFRLRPGSNPGRSRTPSERPKPGKPSLARAGAGDDQRQRDQCSCEIPRSSELEAGEGEAGPEPDRRHHRRVDHPGRQADDRGENGRQPGRNQHPDDQRRGSGSHRRRDERNENEVHEGRDQREPPEVEQDDRGRRRLGRQGNPEDLGDPAPRAARAWPGEPRGQRRTPGQDARGRQDRESEAGVLDPGRVEEKESRDRPTEGGSGRAWPAHLTRQQRDAGHDAGPNDGRRRSHEGDVDHDPDGGQGSSPATAQPARERAEGRCDDRDVPAGDRDDVTRAGRREVGREPAIDPVAQADQDAGGQPCLRFGHRQGETFRGGAAERLERARERAVRGQEREPVRTQRADGADPREVRPVVVIGRQPDPTVKLDAVAGDDRRIPRQRRGDQDGLLDLEGDHGRA
jgi:hypothetical protein